ncbi:hypothetical protein ACWGH5_37755 [Streptomyces sp. NPDC054864]
MRLDLDAVDLHQVAEHPTLRVVQLSTNHSVNLSALRTSLRLEGLELSNAVVQQVGMIADLSGLLSLTLSYEQWQPLAGGYMHRQIISQDLGGTYRRSTLLISVIQLGLATAVSGPARCLIGGRW